MDSPDEIHVEVRGWTNKRIETSWNGCVFVMDDRLSGGGPALRRQRPAAVRSQPG